MSERVIAIISQDDFIKERVKSLNAKEKQFEIEMQMLKNTAENKRKAFKESTKIEVDAIEKRLREKNLLTGNITEHRHIAVSEDADAIFPCEHDPNKQEPSPFPFFLKV